MQNTGTKIIIAIIVAVLVTWACVYIFIFNSSNKTPENNLSQVTDDVNVQAEIKSLTEKVSKFTALPSDDAPQLFEITDPIQLVGKKAFFKDAQKGDKVLVYVKSAKAIIYRESTDKIINVGPVSFDNINKK
jgi:hypothetical protein